MCDYVLEDFTPSELTTFYAESEKVVEALYVMMTVSIDEAMNRYNNR